MKKIVLDIETNAIEDWENLSDLKTIHCISMMDLETGQMHSYNSQTPGEIANAMSIIGASEGKLVFITPSEADSQPGLTIR